jgi:phosphoesterase RecJ-like protein
MTDTSSQIDAFKELIQKSDRIMVTSHISPDPDAVSSTLLLGTTLKHNYPNKNVLLNLEERPVNDLSFLSDYGQLKFGPTLEQLNNFQPDLLIIVDANTYKRVSRAEEEQVRTYASTHKEHLKTAIIDHHEFDGHEETDIFINNKRPATAEEIYVLCFEQMGLQKPDGYAETTLLGIISDTQRHKFDHPGYRETYRVVANLLDDGASIEKLENKLEHYTKGELEAISHLAANITSGQEGYTYSFVSDDFLAQWTENQKSDIDLKNAVDFFVGKFIRNFEGNQWGFVIYPDVASGKDCWGVSFRSLSGIKDVSAVARKLGGGGHKPAAGAKVEASSVQDALAKVKNAIETSL